MPADVNDREHHAIEPAVKKLGSGNRRPVYANKLLNRLSEVDHALIAPHLTLVQFIPGTVLATPDTLIEGLVFLESGIASVTLKTRLRDYEISMIGSEGVLNGGLAAGETMHVFKTNMFSSGKGYVLDIERFLKAAALSPSLNDLVMRFQYVEAIQRATSGGAVAGHKLRHRVARWILMTQDRLAGIPQVLVTHEHLANLLAVRRPGITLVMQELEGEGAIRNNRGFIYILDRERLIREAAGSYGVAEAAYERLLGSQPGTVPRL